MNLKPFRLTLPINANGQPTGKPMAVEPVLPSTYFKGLFEQQGDYTMMACPAKAATTANATRGRCELGEIKTWNAARGGRVNALFQVDEWCDRFNLLQIHAEVGEPMKLAIMSDGTFDLVDEQDADGPLKHYKLSPTPARYQLGQDLNASLWMNATHQGCDVILGGVKSTAQWPLTNWWKSDKRQMKFRGGIYRASDDSKLARIKLIAFKAVH